MELFFRFCLFISGMINFIPTLLAFLPNKIESSYGISIPNSNHELLLRHRAVMLGIIGGVMIFSALSKKYYNLSTFIGLTSMVSFLVFYKLTGAEINQELNKVMKMDILGIIILVIGLVAFKFKQ